MSVEVSLHRSEDVASCMIHKDAASRKLLGVVLLSKRIGKSPAC